MKNDRQKWIPVQIEGMHSVIIPDNLAQSMLADGKNRVVVHGRYQDHQLHFHAALQKIKGLYRIMFSKKNQKALKLEPNSVFEIMLAPDQSKYGVEMPEELTAVLQSDPRSLERFEQLSDGLKRSLIYYVRRYKTSQTRIDKSLIIANNLNLGVTDGRDLVVDRR